MYGIQRLLAPLYKMDPPRLMSQIPRLMTVIRNVYSTSRFYNTTERLQVLLVKVRVRTSACGHQPCNR